jgi:hypothetical protein
LHDEGTICPAAAWLEDVYRGHTSGWYISRLAMIHPARHLAEADAVCHVLGVDLGKR